MSVVVPFPATQPETTRDPSATPGFVSFGDDPTVLTDIYKENVNIAIWRRVLSSELLATADAFAKANPAFEISKILSPDDAVTTIYESLGTSADCVLSNNIAELVEMFCSLFELKRTGLRLGVLTRAMCPRFHVDRVPCRMITTYQGCGSEWVPNDSLDRSKLGPGSGGLPDSHSGLLKSETNIEQLGRGEVALLKGESWAGNEGAGLVHRSPAVSEGDHRLLLSLDFVN
ncbi:MAG: DUF1826 domain-containing protein [Pseudomonadota bacterium]